MSTVHIDRYLDLDKTNPVARLYYVGFGVGSSWHAVTTNSDLESALDSLESHRSMFPDRTYSLVCVECLISKFS